MSGNSSHEARSEGPGTAANSTPPETIRLRRVVRDRVCGQRLSE